MKELYKKIKNDKDIIHIYDNIHKYEEKEKGWAYHDYNHVINVSELTARILEMFDSKKELIYSAQIAAILHDVGALQGKENHAQRSYEFAKEYFLKNNIDFKYKNDVLEAIKIHSDGFTTENMIAIALILSDKLDVKFTRISEEGKKVIGNRQYANINDIEISNEKDTFVVNFITNNQLIQKEFLDYYFTKKIFKAIDSFASKFNKKAIIKIDGQVK